MLVKDMKKTGVSRKDETAKTVRPMVVPKKGVGSKIISAPRNERCVRHA
jgi:hypothetical protein